MKWIAVIALSWVGLASCTQEGSDNTLAEPDAELLERPGKFEFYEPEFDFGTVAEGEYVLHDYKFKNVGEFPLFIVGAKSSCGCTVPSYPKQPIAPGEEGVISVRFSSLKKSGDIEKTIRISANTQPNTITKLKLRGHVVN